MSDSTSFDITTHSIDFPSTWPDLRIEWMMSLEHAHMHYPWVRFFNIDADASNSDELYREAEIADYVYEPQRLARMACTWNPQQEVLTRYGVDTPQELSFTCPLAEMHRLGLVTLNEHDPLMYGADTVTRHITLGSRIVYGHQRYSVKSVHPGPMWGQSLIPMDFMFEVEKEQRASYNLQE